MRLDRPWVPLVLVTDRWWIETGVRLPGVRATVHFEWSDRWEDHARPHVIAELRVWRFHLWARVGGFWRSDEDGDLASLVSIGATFSTYGMRNVICRLRGHVPYRIRPDDTWVFCDRCNQTLSRPDTPGPGGPGGGLPVPVAPDADRLAA